MNWVFIWLNVSKRYPVFMCLPQLLSKNLEVIWIVCLFVFFFDEKRFERAIQHQPHTFFLAQSWDTWPSSSRGHEGLWYLRWAQVVLNCWILSTLITTSRRGFRTDKQGEHEVVKTRKASVISASRYYWKHINKALFGHLVICTIRVAK